MTADTPSAIVSPVDLALMRGDVRALSPGDRVALLRRLVTDAGIRWGGSPPLLLITTREGKLVPYLTKSGADQLAAIRDASVTGLDIVDAGGTVDATAYATDRATGRTNVDVGSCDYGESPSSRARARMVAATRARRRVLLGLLGAGFAWVEEGDRQAGLEDLETDGELADLEDPEVSS